MEGLARVIFAVAVPDQGMVAELGRLIGGLERFYAKLNLGAAHVRALRGALVGAIGTNEEPLVWGERLPASLDIAGSSHDGLRNIHGTTGAIATRGDEVTIVNAAAGPATIYEAQGADGRRVWSSHALAAGWLAHGQVELDPDAIPELLAFDFVGGGRTLLRDVRALPPATRVRIEGGTVTSETWWEPQSRWQLVPERDAAAEAERALLHTLDSRLRHQPSTFLALTAGADSRVVALALHELGAPLTTFTWGEPGWEDVTGAARVAAALGLPHHAFQPEWLADDDAFAAFERGARFADGVFPLAAAERHWPREASAIIGGMGGEIGRAFYYGPGEAYRASGSRRDLERPPNVPWRIAGADPYALDRARSALREWIDEATAITGEGWRALDVLYAEQRVRYWGRSQLPCSAQPVMGAFTPVPVARALASLPLDARLRDAFPHTFVHARRADLAPPTKPLPARPGRLRRLLGGRPRRAPAGDAVNPAAAGIWRERARLRDWVCEEVLAHPLIRGPMGDAWSEQTRAGFLEGRRRATSHALLACGPVALQRAIETDLHAAAADSETIFGR